MSKPHQNPVGPPHEAEPTTSEPSSPVGWRRPRIAALDVLRGFALCGIALVNIGPVTHFGEEYALPTLTNASGWLQLFVQQRFFPIFSLLFGMGFSLFLASSARRASRPRVLLLRRLLVLLLLGVGHGFLHPGEALLPYAIVGLVLLLPSSWLPPWAVAGLSAVLTTVALTFTSGGLWLIPGMFLLGSSLVRYGMVERLDRSWRGPLVLLLVFLAASLPAVLWQLGDLSNSNFSHSSAVAGLTMAGAYVCLVLLLLQTPARRSFQAVFVPLGRMALTNYVSATVLMIGAQYLFDLPTSGSWALLLSLAVAILVCQWAFCVLWLRRFTQGPLEWAWRTVTWWEPQTLWREAPAVKNLG